MVCAKDTVKEHVGVTDPAHGPVLHDVNFEPEAATALRVTVLPPAYEAKQVAPQEIFAGDSPEVTVPVPSPCLVTATV